MKLTIVARAVLVCALGLAASGAVALEASKKAPIPQASKGVACTVIDTDFDIDDIMALLPVLQTRPVAAIIVTEGAALAQPGAMAASKLSAVAGRKSVPVIVGESHPGMRDVSHWKWLPAMRADMHRANGLLTTELQPEPQALSLVERVKRAVAGCNRISLLVIGPFTSFQHYGPALRARIDRVVMQGRPFDSKEEGDGSHTFNCEYDLAACKRSFSTLQKLRAIWVDVNKKAEDPYSPTHDMIDRLRKDGLAGSFRAAVLAISTNWEANPQTGNKSYLWDQLAALYFLRPDLYYKVGAHMEAKPSARDMQRLWTDLSNRAEPQF